jgi:hypothetical protein
MGLIFHTEVLQGSQVNWRKPVKKSIVYFPDKILEGSVIYFSKSDGKERRAGLWQQRKFEIQWEN